MLIMGQSPPEVALRNPPLRIFLGSISCLRRRRSDLGKCSDHESCTNVASSQLHIHRMQDGLSLAASLQAFESIHPARLLRISNENLKSLVTNGSKAGTAFAAAGRYDGMIGIANCLVRCHSAVHHEHFGSHGGRFRIEPHYPVFGVPRSATPRTLPRRFHGCPLH